jgi:hypothetical protein
MSRRCEFLPVGARDAVRFAECFQLVERQLQFVLRRELPIAFDRAASVAATGESGISPHGQFGRTFCCPPNITRSAAGRKPRLTLPRTVDTQQEADKPLERWTHGLGEIRGSPPS